MIAALRRASLKVPASQPHPSFSRPLAATCVYSASSQLLSPPTALTWIPLSLSVPLSQFVPSPGSIHDFF